MSTPYETITTELAKKEAMGKELRKKIVRAQAWSQLFRTPQEAKADFLENIVGDYMREYRDNGTLLENKVEPDPKGNIHILVRKEGFGNTNIQRLGYGNVVIKSGNSTKEDIITPMEI